MTAQPVESPRHHPLANKTVLLNATAKDPARGIVVEGAEFRIEDYWHVLTGQPWYLTSLNWAVMHYGNRVNSNGLPIDDEVVYGKIGPYGHLVHVSELGEVVSG